MRSGWATSRVQKSRGDSLATSDNFHDEYAFASIWTPAYAPMSLTQNLPLQSTRCAVLEARVRKATVEDIGGLERVINQHWRVNIDHNHELRNRDAVLLIAETTGRQARIVGTGLMWITRWNKTGYLVELAVDKVVQRMGIGKRLISEFSKYARHHRLRGIIVETQPDNADGMDFYLANGFRLCGINDRYYTNSPKSSHDIAIFFSLDLDTPGVATAQNKGGKRGRTNRRRNG